MTPSLPRVLLISPQPFFQWRGSPLRVRFDAQALAESGYAVDLLVMPVGDDFPIPGVTCHRAPNIVRAKNLPIGPSPAKAVLDVSLYFKASALARRNSYAVIHGIEDAGPIAAVLARRHRTKFVFEKHSDPASYKKKGSALRNAVMAAYRRVERFSLTRADAIIATGPALADQARAAAPSTPVHHIFDIPSSLVEPDPARSKAVRASWNLPPGAVVALYVGSFASYQGLDLLFDAIPRACAACPNLHFAVIGGTPAQIAERRAQMESAACASRVFFPDRVHPDDLPHTLAAADIMLSPRIAGDNTPLKLLDYFKSGRPIVACDNPANRLVVGDTAAALCDPTPEAFAAAVASLAADPAARSRIASAGHALYLSTYNYTNYKRLLSSAYTQLLVQP
jgi:glycosyltransferase involved in cell wall biosynthesis